MDVTNQMLQELEEFVSSKKGVDTEEAKADPKGQALKKQWLAVLDDMVKADESGTLASAMRQVDAGSDDIRAAVGKLVYEGKATPETVGAVLQEQNVDGAVDANGCAVCSACSACIACAACALCFISAVAVATTIGSVSVTSTISAISK